MQKPTRPVQPVQKKSPEEYFKILDELLKKNKGYGTLLAQDTGSNIPLNLTSNATPVRMPELSGGVVALQQADEALQKAQSRVQQPSGGITPYTPPQKAVDNGDVLGANDFSNVRTPQDFNKALSGILNKSSARQPDPNNLGGYLPNDKESLYPYNPYPGQQWSPNSQESIDAGMPFPALIPFDQTPHENGQHDYLYGNEIRFADGKVGTLNSNDGAVTMADLFPQQQKKNLVGSPQMGPIGKLPGSQNELIQQMFAGKRSQADVTGEVGAPYGLPGEAYNEGLDIGTGQTGNLPAYSPFAGRVVGMTYSQYGGQSVPGDFSEANGYGWGNSVMIELPNGVRMHYAHLDSTPLKIGDVVNPNTFIGTTGESGNAYGKHASISFRPPGGDVSTPQALLQYVQSSPEMTASDFLSAVSKDQRLTSELIGYTKPTAPQSQNSDLSASRDNGLQINSPGELPVQQMAQEQPSIPQQVAETSKNAFRKVQETGDVLGDQIQRIPLQAQQAKQALATNTANTIDKINPTGTGFDLGITEGLRSEPNLARVKQADTVQNISNTFASLGKNLKLPELGISEVGSKLANLIDPKVYASGIEQPNASTPPQQIQGGLDTLKRASSPTINETQISSKPSEKQYKAGQGVDSLKDYFPGVTNVATNVFKKIPLEKVSGSKKLGEASVGGEGVDKSIGGPLSSIAGLALNDNRDQFFKAGGADLYKDYLKTGVNSKYKGALDINLFKDTFFEDPNRVANTFANTYLAKPATEKYRTYIYNAFPVVPGHDKPTYRATARGRYDDGTEWSQDYDEVDQIYYQNQYNQGIRNSVPAQLTSDFKFTAPSRSSSQKPGKAAIAAAGTYMAPSNMSPINSGMLSSKPNAPSSIIPSTSLAQAYTQTQSSPVLYSQSGAVIPKSSGYSTPTRTPVPTPTKASVSAPSRQSSAPQQSSQSRPSSAPAPAPTPSQAPKSVAPTYQAPKSTPAPQVNSSQPNRAPSSPVKQSSKPAPAPAKSTNVFKQILSWLGF